MNFILFLFAGQFMRLALKIKIFSVLRGNVLKLQRSLLLSLQDSLADYVDKYAL